MSFYDSLRLGYPIGALLFLTSDEGHKLGPRSFHGAGKVAENKSDHKSLVLDGQQRITAALSIYYGLEDVDGSEYYIDVNRVTELLEEQKVNIEEDGQVESFCQNIEIDDGYLVAKKKRADRVHHFHKSSLLWTAMLTDESHHKLDEILDEIDDPRQKKIIRQVIRRHLKPKFDVQIPIIELGNDFDLASIARVFTTINTTGRLLTPFELVVATLYPQGIFLEDDVSDFKSAYIYYNNMDKNGEILLQTIAMFSERSPKKSDLPKNIDHFSYNTFRNEAAHCLDRLGEFLTSSLGCGLDVTDKLVPYDAVFAPMALALAHVKEKGDSHTDEQKNLQKIRQWFVASTVMQRYQEGVHNKQQKDLADVKEWVNNDRKPSWISDAYVSPSILHASPSGAIGKLFQCFLNKEDPIDPLTAEKIGYRQNVAVTELHHIFPSRWVKKGIKDYAQNSMDTNVALNTMFLHKKTNGDWLNFAPNSQINQCLKTQTREAVLKHFDRQFIPEKTIQILEKSEFSAKDYHDFLRYRYEAFSSELQGYGIQEVSHDDNDQVEPESPSIIDD